MSNDYSLIIETMNIVSSSDLEVLEESKTDANKPKVKFRSKLQEQNVKNQNNRVYSQSICENIVNQLSPKANSRSLLMEIDHPLLSDQAAMKKRANIIELKNCGSLISNITFENGKVIGDVETLSGFKGPDLARLIYDDKVDIGFSLRAMGSIKKRHDNVLEVTAPMKAITYDVVTNPSFSDARILQFIPENDYSLLKEDSMNLMYESEDIELAKNDQINFESSGMYCVESFVDDIISDKLLSVLGKKINFNI